MLSVDRYNVQLLKKLFPSVTAGMPKEKYEPPDPRRMYTIMSTEEAANGKKSYWAELEITGEHCTGPVAVEGCCSHIRTQQVRML